MLEQLLIFTRGGLILWTCRELGNALKGSPIESLIRSCLLEERSADASFNYDAPGANYTLKWSFHNDLGLVFVAVYQQILHLLYVDDLLAAVRREFSQIYDPKRTSYNDFDETFRQLQKEAEARAEELRKLKQAGKAPQLPAKKPAQRLGTQGNGKQRNNGAVKDDSDGESGKGISLANGSSNGHANGAKGSVRSRSVVKDKENGPPEEGAFDVNKLRKLRPKAGKKTDTGVSNKGSKAEPKKNVKKDRVWEDSPSKAKLDFTNPSDERGDNVVEVAAADLGESKMDEEEVLSSESEEEEDEQVENAKTGSKKKGWFSSMFQSIAGNAILEKSDLEPALKALKDRLMTKNVIYWS